MAGSCSPIDGRQGASERLFTDDAHVSRFPELVLRRLLTNIRISTLQQERLQAFRRVSPPMYHIRVTPMRITIKDPHRPLPASILGRVLDWIFQKSSACRFKIWALQNYLASALKDTLPLQQCV